MTEAEAQAIEAGALIDPFTPVCGNPLQR